MMRMEKAIIALLSVVFAGHCAAQLAPGPLQTKPGAVGQMPAPAKPLQMAPLATPEKKPAPAGALQPGVTAPAAASPAPRIAAPAPAPAAVAPPRPAGAPSFNKPAPAGAVLAPATSRAAVTPAQRGLFPPGGSPAAASTVARPPTAASPFSARTGAPALQQTPALNPQAARAAGELQLADLRKQKEEINSARTKMRESLDDLARTSDEDVCVDDQTSWNARTGLAYRCYGLTACAARLHWVKDPNKLCAPGEVINNCTTSSDACKGGAVCDTQKGVCVRP